MADRSGLPLNLPLGQTIGTGGGTVTSIVAGTGLTGGTIVSTGTLAVDIGTGASQIPTNSLISTAIVTATAGEAINTSSTPLLVYKDVFNQRSGGASKWYLVDTAATGPVKISPVIGFATTTAAGSGSTFTCTVGAAAVSGFTGLTANTTVWASSTAGSITQTEPAVPSTGTQNAARVVGYATSTTAIMFNPNCDTVFQYRNSALASASSVTLEHYADSGARERVARAYVAVPTNALVSGATGTNMGTYTGGGGLAAAFDGTLSKTSASCAQDAGLPGDIGKDYGGSPKTPVSIVITSSSDNGFSSGSNSYSVRCWGSNSAYGSGGTQLGSTQTPGSDPAGGSLTFTFSNTTAYRYVWVEFYNDATANGFIAQVQIYEAGAARDEPLTIGSETVNSTATDRVTCVFSDTSSANGDTKTTFYNRTNATRDIIAEVTL